MTKITLTRLTGKGLICHLSAGGAFKMIVSITVPDTIPVLGK